LNTNNKATATRVQPILYCSGEIVKC